MCTSECVCACVCSVEPVKALADWSNYRHYPRDYPSQAPQGHLDPIPGGSSILHHLPTQWERDVVAYSENHPDCSAPTRVMKGSLPQSSFSQESFLPGVPIRRVPAPLEAVAFPDTLVVNLGALCLVS